MRIVGGSTTPRPAPQPRGGSSFSGGLNRAQRRAVQRAAGTQYASQRQQRMPAPRPVAHPFRVALPHPLVIPRAYQNIPRARAVRAIQIEQHPLSYTPRQRLNVFGFAGGSQLGNMAHQQRRYAAAAARQAAAQRAYQLAHQPVHRGIFGTIGHIASGFGSNVFAHPAEELWATATGNHARAYQLQRQQERFTNEVTGGLGYVGEHLGKTVWKVQSAIPKAIIAESKGHPHQAVAELKGFLHEQRAIAQGQTIGMHPSLSAGTAINVATMLPFLRGPRAVFEASRAIAAAEEAGVGGRLLEGGREGAYSFKSGQGLIRPTYGAGKRLLVPSERTLARSESRAALFRSIDQIPGMTRATSQAYKRKIDQILKTMKARGTAGDIHEAVSHLRDVKTNTIFDARGNPLRTVATGHGVPEEALAQGDQALFQATRGVIPKAPHHELPANLDIGAIADKILAEHPKASLPKEMRTKAQLVKTIQRVYGHVEQGMDYRDWYKRYAKIAHLITDDLGGVVTPEQFARIRAVSSQQAMPTEEIRRAVTMIKQHQGMELPIVTDPKHKLFGQPHTYKGMPKQQEKVSTIIEGGVHEGEKTNNYFLNALKYLNPKEYARTIQELGLAKAPVTVDRHITKMVAPSLGETPGKAYEPIADIFRHLGDEIGIPPEEAQAAAWVPWKAKAMQGREILRGHALQPVEHYMPTAADAGEFGRFKYSGTLFQGGEKGGAEGHTFDSNVAQIHSEIRPEERFWPERAAAFDQWSPEHQAAYAKLVDQAVGHEFEQALGLRVGGKRDGVGVWRGVATPGIAHHVLIDGELTSGNRAEIEALAAAKGLAKHQASVSWGIPRAAGSGEFDGIHWTPPAGMDAARASQAMDTVAGEGNVGFIHAPDGGYYVIDFQGRSASRPSTTTALRNLGGEQTKIGWDGSYTYDSRDPQMVQENPGVESYQEAIAKLPPEQRSALDLAMTRVRGRMDTIDSEYFKRPGSHVVSIDEARRLAPAGTHVFHGTPGLNPEQIMAERRLRTAGEPQQAWTTTDPELAHFHAGGGEGRNIVAIPRDRVPLGEANAPHPFGAIGVPDDILLQRGEGDVVHLADSQSAHGGHITKPATYLRFGDLPEGPSASHLVGGHEAGVSTYAAWKDPATGKYVMPSGSEQYLATQGEIASRPIYEVTGVHSGLHGDDGEPLLDTGSAQIVRRVHPDEVVSEQEPGLTMAGKELPAHETPDWHGGGRFDHLTLDELHARQEGLDSRYNMLVDDWLKATGERPGDYRRLTAYQNATAKKTLRRTGRRAPPVSEMMRDRAEQHLDAALEADPENPLAQAIRADQAESVALRHEIYKRQDELFQQEAEGNKGAFVRHDEQTASMHFFEDANASTPGHEIAHWQRAFNTTHAENHALAEWAGATRQGDGSWLWHRDAEEKYARAYEWYMRSGKAPRNLVNEFKQFKTEFERIYPKGALEEPPQHIQDIIRAQMGHDESSAILHFLLRHGRVAGRAVQGAQSVGPPRSAEDAGMHLDTVNNARTYRGFGIKASEIPRLAPGEVTDATGGELGQRVREHIGGHVDTSGMGEYEGIGARSELRSQKEMRKEQLAGYSVERGKRASAAERAYARAGGGVPGHIAAKEELRGELPKETTKNLQLNPDETTQLFDFIEAHPGLAEKRAFSRIRARDSLQKLTRGEPIQKNEQDLLGHIFGQMEQPTGFKKAWEQMGWKEKALNIINLPRSLMATGDQSAAFRHGIMGLAHNPRQWGREWGPMYKAMFSESSYQEQQAAIHEMANYPLMTGGDGRTAIAFTEAGRKLTNREEQYASDMAERLPGVGKIIRGSDRGYIGFLNGLRAAQADQLYSIAAMQGWDLHDPHLVSSINKFVNSATGRGDLGALQKHAVTLNTLLFSPRLLWSRLNFLNPVFYARLHPFARRQALRAMSNLVMGASAVMYMAKLGGAQVEINPQSSDFGKLRFGNTRIDPFGGFQQPIVLAARLLTSTTVSSSGHPIKLTGKAYGMSYLDIIQKFFANKLAPLPSAGYEAATMKDPLSGQPVGKGSFLPDIHHLFGPEGSLEKNFILKRVTPLLLQDIASLPPGKESALGVLPALGIGAQAYGPPLAGQKRLDAIMSQTRQAGLGKPPAAAVADAKWKAELDNATYSGQSNYDKMKAAAKIFDQRYGTNLEPLLAQRMTTDAQAAAEYSKLAARIAPMYDHWMTNVTRRLNAVKGQQPTPAATVHKSSAPALPSVDTSNQAAYHVPAGEVRQLASHTQGLPSELGHAIDSAAAKYHVPASTLKGIWAIESGRTFPNPAVNSSGYGGLFGTTKWNASTAEQADYAASTLHHLLVTHGGNMAAALHAYSGGGYTSVPGGGGPVHLGSGAGARVPSGGAQFASLTTGGGGGTGGSNLNMAAETILRDLAQGSYSPSQFLSKTLNAFSTQPLQGNVQGITFELPKGGKAAPAARGAIALAEHYLGTPYVWGGESPSGFDCSGLLQFIYAKQGIRIPRTSQLQFEAGRRVGKGALRPGDAVFFAGSDGTRSHPGHVGIYIGGGRFIEAPHSGSHVRISNLNGYPGYVGARRFTR